MEKEDQINIMAALITSGYIINTAFDIEDVNEALKTFRRFKHEFENLESSSDDKEIIEDIDIIATILAAGQIVNTHSHIEGLEETLEVYKKMRSSIVRILKKVPDTFKEKSDLNVVAAILAMGLIVNSKKWEEDILETAVLLKACKEGLINLP